MESGDSFSIMLDEYDQIWVGSENKASSNASVKISLRSDCEWYFSEMWDTFLTSEDGERVFYAFD